MITIPHIQICSSETVHPCLHWVKKQYDKMFLRYLFLDLNSLVLSVLGWQVEPGHCPSKVILLRACWSGNQTSLNCKIFSVLSWPYHRGVESRHDWVVDFATVVPLFFTGFDQSDHVVWVSCLLHIRKTFSPRCRTHQPHKCKHACHTQILNTHTHRVYQWQAVTCHHCSQVSKLTIIGPLLFSLYFSKKKT